MRGHIRKKTWVTKAGETRHGYEVIISYRDGQGRRRQRSRMVRTRREAERLMRQWIEQLEGAGGVAPPGRITVNDLFEQHFFPHCRRTLEAATTANYERVARKHILPRLGGERLERLSPAALNRFYGELLDDGVGIPTIRRVHATLHRAFNLAVKWGLALANPVTHADPPRVPRPEPEDYDAETLRRLLEAARQDRLYPLWFLLSMTGLRRGEACALRWGDVDLDSGTLVVRRARVVVEGRVIEKEPKSRTGRRVITLPPAVVDALRKWAVEQKRERLRLGPHWRGEDYIFTTEEGTPLRPDSLQKRTWKRLLRAAGLPEHLRIHDLRHLHATVLAHAGVPAKTIQARLGHHSAAFTLDRYGHAMRAADADAALRAEQAVLGGGEDGTKKRQA